MTDMGYSHKCNTCRTDCVERPLAKLFKHYGHVVGQYPLPFLIIPIALTILLGLGFLNFNSESDIEYLFTPTNGRAKDERKVMESYFSFSENGNFSNRHKRRLEAWTELTIMTADGGNVLTPSVVHTALEIDKKLREFEVSEDSDPGFKFTDICAKWNDDCVENSLLVHIYNRDSNTVNQVKLQYPTHDHFFIGGTLGGVDPELGSSTSITVQTAKALKLRYHVLYETDQEKDKANQWFDKFKAEVESWESDEVVLVYSTTNSMEEELDEASAGIIPLFSVTYTLVITFSILTCLTLDQVRTKGWVAFAGVLSAGLAVVSAFGLLLACGVPFTSQVAAMPFLVLGIGVDDMFVMVAAWRQTSVTARCPDRMSCCLRDAGMSITITSITDFLAFVIGATSSFRSVRIFCLFTGVSVIFAYIYCITFLAACFVLDGRREERNRHGIFPCKTCKTQDQALSDGNTRSYMWICAGGIVPQNDEKVVDHGAMNLFRDRIGPFLMKLPVKVIVLAIYVTYLATAIWGCTNLTQGLQLKNLANDNSYLSDFYSIDRKYFDQIGPSVSVMFTGDNDYTETMTHEAVQKVIDDLEMSAYVRNNMSDSWLPVYQSFLQETAQAPNSEEKFVQILNEVFLQLPQYERYRTDIILSDDKKTIVASMAHVLTYGLTNANEEKDMMTSLRDIVDKADMEVTIFNPAFIFFDQYVVILQSTLINLGIASGVMLVIALFLVPHPVCALWVAFSIVSIEIGVVGYMSFWDVSLDSVSMINLILCIGFSVDFAAHITYGFIASPAPTKNGKAIDALYKLGFPVTQGACSTILGVVVLASSDSYIFRTFFKTMFLVILLGLCHGIVFLPVILSFLGVSVDDRAHPTDESPSPKNNGIQMNTSKFIKNDTNA